MAVGEGPVGEDASTASAASVGWSGIVVSAASIEDVIIDVEVTP